MKSQDRDEYVLVFPTDLIKTIGYFEGLSFEPDKFVLAIEETASFRPRSAVEDDPLYKQLIPYVIITHGQSVLSYRRGTRSTETRLAGNRSIGIGGHVSATDPNLFTPSYVEGMNRELREEIEINTPYTIKLVALLNDDSNDVGKVHFGLVHIMALKERNISKKEQVISDLKFIPIEDLSRTIEEYENWSQLCIRNLVTLFSAATAARPDL
ncbi:phosphoesterase [candidate division WS5 bacterium]|uniref:Phosphoesterase n=1 Tax=candidate division WS5 bacterium TaxID=2093353 RepID=A0A419DD51_9BACT|nr:MAG: phosphoesterase [candidate division WS5 bacterium]